MRYERLLDKNNTPTNKEIIDTIGVASNLWILLHEFISKNYDFIKELAFFSKNYGWTVRYRKSKKTLISCFPENGAFSALIVLGKKESEEVDQIRSELTENILSIFDTTEQLHDGRWLWIRITNKDDLDSLVKLIKIKRKPKKK